jgi:hypothetical protein
MARIDLPSGNWIEYRDALKAKDRFAVQNAIKLTMTSQGTQEYAGGTQNAMVVALLTRLITSWSFEDPVPSANGKDPEDVLGDVLDIDDYAALEEATEELMNKVVFTGPNRRAGTSMQRSGRSGS